ncbi:putative hydrolase of the HAD superfamily [Alkalihalobacillus xiaoxiensis]|uniref:Hydrolase of the HAD superfamily n=1 Tax=Shouchella xiaoxiensis TaxID=766895 RepID=A0ABS2SZ32_9BACI|nr:HAD family hydrolase [Shouchella xiaoxiensis]MBM7840515.1 putative hydrolase of the HAD superfamily [Shouchella xiaoxiensis]
MIFFDLDDTLLNHEEAERKGALLFRNHYDQLKNRTELTFEQQWKTASAHYFRHYLNGKISFEEQRIERIRAIFSDSITTKEARERFEVYIGYYEKNWSAFSDVHKCLQRISKVTKIGVITNGKREQQVKKIQAIGLSSMIDFLICSDDIGQAKPSVNLYHHACNRVGKDPAVCLYVGDNLKTDVYGSLNAGMEAIWLNRKRKPVPMSVNAIVSLSELSY